MGFTHVWPYYNSSTGRSIQKVFSEAEEMAKKYRQKLSAGIAASKHEKPPTSDMSFDEPTIYANWKWFKFERESE